MENRKISSNGWKAIESSQNPSIIAAYSAYKDSQEKDLENLGPQYYSQAIEGHFDYSSESTNALLDNLLELCEEEGLRIYESFIKKFESFDADEDAERMKEDEIYSSMDEEDEADEIVARFEEEFGDNEPTVQEFAEFYHMLRTEGIDGIKIFNALEGLIPENEEEEEEEEEDGELLAYDADTDADQMEEDEIYSSMDEEDVEEDEAQYERKSLKRFNDFK
jgi:hypothetical protein